MFATFGALGDSVKVVPLWTAMKAMSAVEKETRLIAASLAPGGRLSVKYSRSPVCEVARIEFVPTPGESAVGARRLPEMSRLTASSWRTTALAAGASRRESAIPSNERRIGPSPDGVEAWDGLVRGTLPRLRRRIRGKMLPPPGAPPQELA